VPGFLYFLSACHYRDEGHSITIGDRVFKLGLPIISHHDFYFFWRETKSDHQVGQCRTRLNVQIPYPSHGHPWHKAS